MPGFGGKWCCDHFGMSAIRTREERGGTLVIISISVEEVKHRNKENHR